MEQEAPLDTGAVDPPLADEPSGFLYGQTEQVCNPWYVENGREAPWVGADFRSVDHSGPTLPGQIGKYRSMFRGLRSRS